MKRKVYYAVFVVMLFLVGCSQEVVREQSENYVPPSVKIQPKLFYPIEAQAQSYYGLTKIVIIISKTGTVNRAVVIKSSGHEVLDKAATEYCKEIVFNPATKDGVPIESRVLWEVNYNFVNQKWNSYSYLNMIDDLYSRANYALKDERMMIEREILEKHTEFIKKMTDAINFNEVIAKVIKSETVQEWKHDWNSWPLSFLLYHDFLMRFPDFDSSAAVKNILKNAINYDIQYINKQHAANMEIQKAKDAILIKIKKFVAKYYPDIIIDSVSTETVIRIKPMS